MGTYPTSLALYGPKEGPSQANARPQGIDKGLTRDQPEDHREEVLRSHDMIKIVIEYNKIFVDKMSVFTECSVRDCK